MTARGDDHRRRANLALDLSVEKRGEMTSTETLRVLVLGGVHALLTVSEDLRDIAAAIREARS